MAPQGADRGVCRRGDFGFESRLAGSPASGLDRPLAEGARYTVIATGRQPDGARLKRMRALRIGAG